MGFINRALEDAALADDARKIAQSLRFGAVAVVAAVRRFLLSSFSQALETQMELEARSISEAAYGEHGRKGIRAFLGEAEARIFLSDSAAQHQSTSHSRIS